MALQVNRGVFVGNCLVVLVCFIAITVSRPQAEDVKNLRPIIGVLAQQTSASLRKNGDEYFMDAYVKYIEMGGARVVPVRTHEPDDYYNQLFRHINGVLFPGGGVGLINTGYGNAAKKIYELAIEANDKGDYFPLWGTCLGLEEMLALRAGRDVLVDCDAENVLMPVVLQPMYKTSRMFQGMSDRVLHTLTTWNVTANFHVRCLTPQVFQRSTAINSFFDILSVNRDNNGLEFVSLMEAQNYPFYGSQWHPEKSVFIWDVSKNLNHSQGAVEVTQYFANFFVNEARKNTHHFPSLAEESRSLISNWHPVFEGAPSFGNNYYFNYTKHSSGKSIAQYVQMKRDLGDGSARTGQQNGSSDSSTKVVLGVVAVLNCLAIMFLVVSILKRRGTSVPLLQHNDKSGHKGAPDTSAYVPLL